MTRKREWYEGAVYHVTVRGNRRNDIFRDIARRRLPVISYDLY